MVKTSFFTSAVNLFRFVCLIYLGRSHSFNELSYKDDLLLLDTVVHLVTCWHFRHPLLTTFGNWWDFIVFWWQFCVHWLLHLEYNCECKIINLWWFRQPPWWKIGCDRGAWCCHLCLCRGLFACSPIHQKGIFGGLAILPESSTGKQWCW